MGKRSTFQRRKNDLYRTTDKRAVAPLLAHLAPSTIYGEPCAADGSLVDLIDAHGHMCIYAADVEPGAPWVRLADALVSPVPAPLIITNPPWSRALLHALIVTLCWQAPTWLLFDADWIHTKQARPFLRYLVKVVSVGRLKWIEGSKHDGKDNCAWYLFDAQHDLSPIEFYGRIIA